MKSGGRVRLREGEVGSDRMRRIRRFAAWKRLDGKGTSIGFEDRIMGVELWEVGPLGS